MEQYKTIDQLIQEWQPEINLAISVGGRAIKQCLSKIIHEAYNAGVNSVNYDSKNNESKIQISKKYYE